MRRFHQKTHVCAPQQWRTTDDVTGDYDMDASIMRSHNQDLRNRLDLYVTNDESYGPITGYSGYRGYRGDN